MPLLMMARHDVAEQAGRTGVATLAPLGEREELADALHYLGWYLWRRGRGDEAEPLLRRAVEMAGRVDSALVRAEATQTLAVCLAQLGRSTESLETIEEAFRLAKEVGEFTNLMRCYNNLPSIVADIGSDLPRAEAVLREGLELAQRAGAKGHEAWLTGSLGDILFGLGHLEEAETLQHRAVDLAVASGDEPLHGMRLTALAAALLFRGKLDEAETVHRRSIPILNANPEPQSQIYIPEIEAYLALARGDRATAATELRTMIDQLRDFNVDVAPRAFAELARTLVREGREHEAEVYRDLTEHGRSAGARANAALVEGLLSVDPGERRRLLAEGAATLEKLDMRIEAARAMVDLGRAMAASGEDPRPTLESARAMLLECDARAWLFEVDTPRRARRVTHSLLLDVSRCRTRTDPLALGFSHTEREGRPSLVNAAPTAPTLTSVIPASCAIRSSSAGQTYRNGTEKRSSLPSTTSR
jgi:tetratricopeptide (TPR) repeat protein